ncbi:hypothetical protein ACFS6H_09955 [Terrimonas rubra]|uniref:YD repeat-containing protein n=1 Tax=Terrimonas rubra TaxID=1035890 RepID=A0ABW6A431_9BACT
MNNFKPLLIIIAYLLLQFLGSCRKDPVVPLPDPQDPGTPTHTFNISVESLPGMISPQGNLTAVVSIVNKQGIAVLTDKDVALTYQDKYFTSAINLAAGEYRISKFLVFGSNNKILYASPLVGSARANEVSTPLPFSFDLNTNTGTIPVHVTIVNTGDTPQQFGYPAGTFISPADESTSMKVNIRTVIKVGNIVYDSIPSTLRLVTWSSPNQSSLSFISLRPGTNEIALPKNAIKYELSVNKWKVTDQKVLLRSAVTDGMNLVLGGEKQARQLKTVNTAILNNGTYIAYVKKDYEYTNGYVSKTTAYKKNEAYETVVAYTENFFYNARQRIQRIQKQITDGGVQEDVFQYRDDGRLQAVNRTEPAGVTTATIGYAPYIENTELGDHYTAGVQYNFTQYYYTQYYNIEFYGGTILTDNMATTHGNSTTGRYQYDFCINPYIHLNIPDLYFENSWKHNRVNSMKEFENVFPLTIPYENIYTYDDEGYPIELVTRYRTYLTGQFSYQTRSVFYYN